MKKNKSLILSLTIALGSGFLCTLLIMHNLGIYNPLLLPNYAPPSFVFMIVWTILYILMGISSHRIYLCNHPDKKAALILYAIQLFLNVTWPFIFFNYQHYLLAVIWMLMLLAVLIVMTYNFYKINKEAGYLMIPYLIWTLFALNLNFNIFLLN